jgi:hypothetical protein
MAQPQNENNAFTFDDDEDMDFLMEKAAQAGSAAVDEQHEGADVGEDLFGGGESLGTAPVAVTAPEPVVEPEPVFEPEPELEPVAEVEDFDLEEEFSLEPEVQQEPEPAKATVSAVEEEMAALQAETAAAVAEEPKVAPTRVPPKADPRVDSIRDLEGRRPVEKSPRPAAQTETTKATQSHQASPRIIRQTEEEQIAHAKAILDAADEYRKLNAQERAVVAQLITQDAEFADDAASIAIRAINAEELTFATMEALKTAKGEEPVDRAFYILGLDEDVRNSLGQLCTAFSGQELQGGNTLAFSRELVREIEKLDSEAIHFVSATEAVLRAAKQR